MKKSRIIYPEDYPGQRMLLGKIKAKYDADVAGSGSVLTAMLTQKGINLADDDTAGTTADGFETDRATQSAKKENFRQLRDLDFAKVWPQFTGSVQFLKSFYKPNVSELGNWKITVNGVARIAYPTDILGKVKNYNDFISYNGTVANSPLAPYLQQQNINHVTNAGRLIDIKTNHGKFLQADLDMEAATQGRDINWNPVNKHIHEIGDFLIKLYSNNTKKLGEYGINVDDSPKAPKYRTSKLKLSEQIVIESVVIGGTLINLGNTVLKVYKGGTLTGTVITVNPGDKVGMTKGFSRILVVNQSTLEDAKFKVLCSK
jgi:hypothetical protein